MATLGKVLFGMTILSILGGAFLTWTAARAAAAASVGRGAPAPGGKQA